MLDREQMLSAFPKDSALFDAAVDAALRQIHNQSALEQQRAQQLRMRRVLGWALAGALLLAGAFGVAEGVRRGVFDFLWQRDTALPQATELVQQDIAERTVGHTTVRATEAVYDGATVRFVLSITNDTVHHIVTEDELHGDIYGDGDMGRALAEDGVTALGSFDWFTIDGTEYSMTGDSSQQNVASESEGEVLVYFELLLSHSEGKPVAVPDGDFTLGIPVFGGQADSQLHIPIRRLSQNLLRDITPVAPTTFGTGDGAYTVTVTQARLSPIRNAVELRVDVPDTASDDAAWEAIGAWYDIALVDEQGAEIGASERNYWGMPVGETDELRHFIIRIDVAPQESYPDRLFVAPLGDDGADMRHAIELNMEVR